MICNRVAIISSIPEELKVYKQMISDHRLGDKLVFLARGGVGKASAAGVTQKIISEKHPDIVFYTGFGGSLERDQHLGDIGVVTAAIDAEIDARSFDHRLKLGQFPFTGERIFRTDPRLVKLAMEADIEMHRFDAYVATTSVFMDSEKKSRFNALILPQLAESIDGTTRSPNIIDMESTGFLTATKANNVPALVLRSISNTKEGNTASEYRDFMNTAKQYAFIVQFILRNIHKV